MVKAKAKAASSDAKTPKKAQAKAPSSAQPDANNRPTRPHKKRPHKKGPHKKGPKEPRKKGPKHLQKKRQARRKVPCPSKDGIVPLRIKTESLPGQKLKQANPEKFSLFSWARVDWHTGEFVYFTKPPPYWAWYLATASALLKKYLKSCDQKQQHELPTALGARKVQLMESHKAGQRHRKSPQGAGKPPGGKEEAGLEDDDADDEDNMQFYNYTDELSRLSYFFYLVPRHTVTIADALKGVTAHIEPVISAKRNARKPVVVTSIGGGQLPDVFGFLVYASQTSHYTPEQRIVFHVYDTAVWKQTCEHGQALVQQFFPNCELHYHVFDATVDDAGSMIEPDCDIFLFAYFFVEMLKYESQAQKFFNSLMAGAKPGALFMSLDPGLEDSPSSKLTERLLQNCDGHAKRLEIGRIIGDGAFDIPRFRFMQWAAVHQAELYAAKANPEFVPRPTPRGKGRRKKETLVFVMPRYVNLACLSVWLKPSGKPIIVDKAKKKAAKEGAAAGKRASERTAPKKADVEGAVEDGAEAGGGLAGAKRPKKKRKPADANKMRDEALFGNVAKKRKAGDSLFETFKKKLGARV